MSDKKMTSIEKNIHNGKHIFNEMNKSFPKNEQLKIVTDASGNEVIADPNGTPIINSQTGEISSNSTVNFTTLMSKYYPQLEARVITQEVLKMPDPTYETERIFTDENWKNGFKDFFINSLLETREWTKIIDFDTVYNPADPIMYQITSQVDKWEIVNLKYSQRELLQSFTNFATLGEFVADLISKMENTFEYKWFLEAVFIILNSPNAIINPSYNEVYNTDGVDTIGILTAVDNLFMELKQPSPTRLNLNPANPKLPYKAKAEDLIIVWNSKFKAEVNAQINAKLFNPEYINLESKDNIILTPTLYSGLGITSPDNFKLAVIDKRKLRKGWMAKGLQQDLKAGNMQQILQLMNIWGYASLFNYYGCLFADLPYPVTTSKASIVIEEVSPADGKKSYKHIQDLIIDPVVYNLKDNTTTKVSKLKK